MNCAVNNTFAICIKLYFLPETFENNKHKRSWVKAIIIDREGGWRLLPYIMT